MNASAGWDGAVRVLGAAWALLMVAGAALMVWWADETTISQWGVAPGVGLSLVGVALAAHAVWRPRRWPVIVVLACMTAFTAGSMVIAIVWALMTRTGD